jgi:hypothetical protein
MRMVRNATPKILPCNPPYDLSHRHDDGGHPEKEMKVLKSRWAFAADSIAWLKLI